jgi:hypothetical protein
MKYDNRYIILKPSLWSRRWLKLDIEEMGKIGLPLSFEYTVKGRKYLIRIYIEEEKVMKNENENSRIS